MPIYEYRCENGHTFDVLQKFADEPLDECEVCGAPSRRVLHPVAIHFKGSGFYQTDYKKSSPPAGESSSAGESSGAGKSEGKSEGSMDAGSSSKSSEGSSKTSGGAAAKSEPAKTSGSRATDSKGSGEGSKGSGGGSAKKGKRE